MSSTSSPPAAKSKKKKATAARPQASRSPSASEIARNFKYFEVWTTHQNCEQVSYLSDIPADIKDDVDEIFDFSTPKLPASWVDSASPEFKSLKALSTTEFMDFLREIHDQSPELYSESIVDSKGLFSKMSIVFSAWRRLKVMRKSKEKWSEADYAANVYNVFRSPAIHESTHKVQCNISLPQPLVTANLGTDAARILGTKTASPDCLVMIPSASIRSLSLSATSPFQVLKRHPKVVKSGTASKCSSFRFQSTPCAVPPETPAFQFVSSFWEDKKPVHQMLEHAYRQNRMATTAAARHLHSLHVQAPVFGLVWASGTVRAHIDWCRVPEGKHKLPVVYSAPYRVATSEDEAENEGDAADIFHEWQLDRAADISQVFFLIENIDRWTMSGFRERVIRGVEDLVDGVNNGKAYVPWKRVGDLPSSAPAKENHTVISAGSTSFASSAPAKKNQTVISAGSTSSAQSTPPQKPPSRRRR
ncbi:hypothetical protein B0H17DRAFT_624226 [Mycena rosella]|uniref:Uncharacterized protein n=1 Tax=Mycena rosella TaxID=1033263 RepID=A0AAD7M930_MYCRO|nr:hypothetical protein B0H17DRAFT_624226 [Mycena rosella]